MLAFDKIQHGHRIINASLTITLFQMQPLSVRINDTQDHSLHINSKFTE